MLGRQATIFAQIVGFELRYYVRQPSTYVYFVIFGLLGWLVAIGDAASANLRVPMNSPITVLSAMRTLSIVGLFVTLAVIADAALRDQRSKMDELIRAAPVPIGTYLLGRFAGAYIVTVILFCGALAGRVAGTTMWWIDPAVVGSFRYDAFLSALAIIALPNLFFGGALFFAAASVTRSTLATYVVLMALLAGHFATFAIGDPAMRWLASLIDPIGRFAIDEVTRYWTPAERGTRLVSFAGLLAQNRLACIAIGSALLALSIAFYRRRAPAVRVPRTVEAASRSAPTVRTRRVPVASSGGAGIWAQFMSCARQETRAILRSWSFLALLVLGVAGCIAFLVNLGESYGTPLLPMTHVVVNTLAPSALFLLLILVALFAGEIVWRERQTGVAPIIDATPVPGFVFLASKLVAIMLMVAAILVVVAAVGIAFQIAKGTRVNIDFYLVGLGLVGLQVMMIAVLATFLQTLVN